MQCMVFQRVKSMPRDARTLQLLAMLNEIENLLHLENPIKKSDECVHFFSLLFSLGLPLLRMHIQYLPLLSATSFFITLILKVKTSIKFLSSHCHGKTINVVLQRCFVPFILSSSSSTSLYAHAMNIFLYSKCQCELSSSHSLAFSIGLMFSSI